MCVLVVGKNSYIAQRFISDIIDAGIQYGSLSVRDDKWQEIDYSKFSSVVYFAAIVHHPEIVDEDLYFKVNASIPYEMALKCKQQGVSQFVYISTCAVWGVDPCFGKDNVIDNNTLAKPKGIYGISKQKGEQLLLTLYDESFRVAVLRLPNVYGANCPGRFYHRLELLSRLFILPTLNVNPLYSLISVENASKAIVNIVNCKRSGILSPQDPTPLSIVDKITQIARDNGRVQYQTSLCSPLIRLIYRLFPNKYFNNLYGGYLISTESFETLTDN